VAEWRDQVSPPTRPWVTTRTRRRVGRTTIRMRRLRPRGDNRWWRVCRMMVGRSCQRRNGSTLMPGRIAGGVTGSSLKTMLVW
jgi:hypothetical protein